MIRVKDGLVQHPALGTIGKIGIPHADQVNFLSKDGRPLAAINRRSNRVTVSIKTQFAADGLKALADEKGEYFAVKDQPAVNVLRALANRMFETS